MSNLHSQNPLYPIFLKLHELDLLLVGAGEVGYEKLFFILKNSPQAQVTVVAPEISSKIDVLLMERPGHRVTLLRKRFEPGDLDGKHLAIAATNDESLNRFIRQAAKKKGVLVNVADTPGECDFYLGAVVTKGDLKIAISTNGKSPTFAKRFRQLLEETLPYRTNDLLQNLHALRDRLGVHFSRKVERLNELTAELLK